MASDIEELVFTVDGDPVVVSSALLDVCVSTSPKGTSVGDGEVVTAHPSPDGQQKHSFDKLLAERRRKIIGNLAKAQKEREASQDNDLNALSDKASSTSTLTPAKFRASLSRIAATATERFDVFRTSQVNELTRSASVTSRRVRNRSSAYVANLSGTFLRLSRGLSVKGFSSSAEATAQYSGDLLDSLSSEEEDMSSPLAHKSKRPPGKMQEANQLSLRNSTFAPSNLAHIPRMDTATELTELSGNVNVTHNQNKALLEDFGHFKVGTAQYSHARISKDHLAKVVSSTLQSAERLKVDPETLKPDADSVHGEICDNDSTSSLKSVVSNASIPRIHVRRSRPHRMSAELSIPTDTSYPDDKSLAGCLIADEPGVRSSFPATLIRTPEESTTTSLLRSSDGNTFINNDPTLPCTLRQVPAASQGYPLIQPDPFSLSMLSTTWNATDARKWKKDLRTKCEDEQRPKNDHILNIVKKTNAAEQIISIHEAAFEGPDERSPPPKTPSRRSLPGSFGRARTATLRSTPGTETSKRAASSALRSVSDIFRGKPIPEPERFSADKFLQDRETYLRTVTNTLPNPNNSMFPRHPNTNEPWMHRNLRCTECSEKCCSRCGRACCAYKAAMEGKKTHTKGYNHYRAAGHAEEIAKLRVYGRELPTFLKCTDCDEIFCPDCCGECADPQCRLVCCRGCKNDPWVNCDWHENH